MTLVIPLSDVMHMELAVFFGIGFFAQLIDGALGMAFGAISTTALLSFGLSSRQTVAGSKAFLPKRRIVRQKHPLRAAILALPVD